MVWCLLRLETLCPAFPKKGLEANKKTKLIEMTA